MTSTGDTTRAPVVVIGAGPAGIAAALAASRTTPTILLDEQASPGGHRRWWPDLETDLSDDMHSTLLDAGVDYRPNTSVWALFEGPTVAAYDDRHAFSIDAGSVVIATGAIDRAWPLPGWQLDGVCTAEAVLRGIENGRLTAGTRVGVVGDGAEAFPLIAAIGRAGGTVALHVPDISSARIGGDLRATTLDDTARSIAVDRVVLALGRRPDPALALMARAASVFDRPALVAMPLLDKNGATSVPSVYVTGEAAGVTEDDAVREHGQRAGEAAASRATADRLVPPVLSGPNAPPLPGDGSTIVCRQQMVDLRTVQTAIERGAYDVNDLRRQTRAGMGLSSTDDTLSVPAALLLRHDSSIDDDRLIGRVRPPVRPLPFRLGLGGTSNSGKAETVQAGERSA